MLRHADWNRLLEPYAQSNNKVAWWQLSTTLTLFAANWIAMLLSLRWSYAITLLLAVPAAGLLARTFIFQHDCGHGSFFDSRQLNDWVGRLLGVVTLTPYDYWRWTHNVHHATSGNLDRRSFGDINTLTVDEYLALGSWQRFMYRAYRNPLIFLSIGPIWQFVFKHRLPLDTPHDRKREWRSVLFTNIAIVLVTVVLVTVVGWKRFLLIQIPIGIFGGVSAIWLFYVQHQFETTYWRRHEEWDFNEAAIKGASFLDLPALARWFTGNIGYHPIHHLSARIPNYRLKECHESIPELSSEVTRLTLLSSFRCGRLSLWDERTERLVGFDALEDY